jgi:hypothetical protein
VIGKQIGEIASSGAHVQDDRPGIECLDLLCQETLVGLPPGSTDVRTA